MTTITLSIQDGWLFGTLVGYGIATLVYLYILSAR